MCVSASSHFGLRGPVLSRSWMSKLGVGRVGGTDVGTACNPARLGFQEQSLMVACAVVWLEQRKEVDDRARKGTKRGTSCAQGLLEALT